MAARYPSLNDKMEDVPALEDLLKCTICMEPYKDPKLLHCGHSFCIACVERLQVRRTVPCPICRKSTPVPTGGVRGLQRDFRVSQIRDAFSAVSIRDSSSQKQHCDICRIGGKRKAGEYSCLQCQKRLCSACIELHSKQPQFRDHTVITADNNLATAQCRPHEENCTHMCKNCQKLVCVTCMLTQCNGHPCIEIGVAVRDMTANIQKLTRNLDQRLIQITDCLEKHETIIASKTKMYDEMEENLKQHSSKLVRTIQERSRNLLESISILRANSMDALQISQMEAKERLRVLKALRSVTSNISGSAIAPQFLSVLPACHTMARTNWAPSVPTSVTACLKTELSLNVATIRTQNDKPVPIISINEDEDLPEILTACTIDCTEDERNFPSAPVIDDPDAICLSEWRSYFRGLQDGWGSSFVKGPQHIAISDRKLNKVVLVHTEEEEMKIIADSRLQNVQLRNPHGVYYSPKLESIMVVCPDGGGLTHLSPVDLSKAGQIQLAKVYSPTGLAALRNGQLVVTEVGTKRHGVSIHDPQGPCLRLWGNRSTATGQSWFNWKSEYAPLDYPYHVAVDHYDRIVVADSTRSEVQLFDLSGKLLLRFGDSNQIGRPAGLGVDNRNNVILVHSKGDQEKVSVFSQDGLLINTTIDWSAGVNRGLGRSLAIHEDFLSVISELECQLYYYQYLEEY